MNQHYVEQREGTYRVGGTRVSLDSVVYAYRRGAPPECIQRSFPALTLEQVYGAIAFYLSRQAEIAEYLLEGEAAFAELQRASRAKHPDWYARMKAARLELV